MSYLREVYAKSLAENEKQLQFWEDYLNKLKFLDFSVFSNELKVPCLVPIGNRILFRGELIHTNEITISLGADYFTKCSIFQAEVIKQHRISDAESKLNSFKKEREYLESRINFNQTNVIESQGREILEPYNEEEDKVWRENHKVNIKKYKQSRNESGIENRTTDDELWNRLEELELQEEIENHGLNVMKVDKNSEVIDNNCTLDNSVADCEDTLTDVIRENVSKISTNEQLEKDDRNDANTLLHQAIERQKELEIKLEQLQKKERFGSRTENDLISRLDELDELDELEDEIDRIDDILFENIEDTRPQKETKRCVSFADVSEEADTLEITFTHTNTEPDIQPYDKDKGIVKPSDIYEAYPLCVKSKTVSILKSNNYPLRMKAETTASSDVSATEKCEDDEEEIATSTNTIFVKDVTENDTKSVNRGNEKRPPSLFKQRRMKNNKS